MSEGSRADQLEAAALAVRSGGVVAFPTETVYGLGADPASDKATGRLFTLKQRPADVALPVLLPRPELAGELAYVDSRARKLIERYWPGPLTIVLRRRQNAPLRLGGDEETVGLRCPAGSLALALLARTGPLAVTSANLHGMEPATDADGVRAMFPHGVDVVVEGGRCRGLPSTVVSLLGREPALLREGALSAAQLSAALRRKVRGA